ncbi:hypothetical protein [Marinobacterium lutimaris]|uniref:Uncharacterized protein n=1 Tax=Marinobacterium lutimaris TaxID=568106 RepID=A0A1H5XQH4_9GAMM|nr:hypothetical protein [Marinobacterium lutimaris]SEG13922.1 hypothetical protein SAMN05444390_1011465 [Marinobacterium lutimaris]
MSKDYYNGCCEFSTFLEGFLSSARRNKVPLVCINRLQARRHWRMGMTGNEALLTQRMELAREGEYNALTPGGKRSAKRK